MPDSEKGKGVWFYKTGYICWPKVLKLWCHIHESRWVLCGRWLNVTHHEQCCPFLYPNVTALTKQDIFVLWILKNSVAAGGKIAFLLHVRTIHAATKNRNICDLKEHSDTFLSWNGWGVAFAVGTEQKRNVESVTRLCKDKTAWSQLGHPDMLLTTFFPGWQGTMFSVLILIHLASVL